MRNILDTIVEKVKINILCSVTFFQNSYRLSDNYGGAKQAADNMAPVRGMLDN